MQLRLVAAGYALVVVVSALLVYQRYLIYVRYPQDVAAAGGMYAGSDLLLEIFTCFLFLVPTVALVFVIRKSESLYTSYAKVLLGLSLTAPLSLGLLIVPALLGRCHCLPIVCRPHSVCRADFEPVADSFCACSPTVFLCFPD